MGLHLKVWAEYLPLWLGKIIAHNQRREILKDIKVPSECDELPCGCTREFYPNGKGDEWQLEWKLSRRDVNGNLLPHGSFRHVIIDPHDHLPNRKGRIKCDAIITIALIGQIQEKVHSSLRFRLREVARKEQSRMLSPFDMVDELASSGKLGPDIASVMIGDGFEPEDVINALREHRYEVHTQLGNEVHLRGVSDYPRGHAKYTPLQRRGTGDLVSAAVGNVTVDVEKSESPYHAKSEHLDPLLPAISWPNPRR